MAAISFSSRWVRAFAKLYVDALTESVVLFMIQGLDFVALKLLIPGPRRASRTANPRPIEPALMLVASRFSFSGAKLNAS